MSKPAGPTTRMIVYGCLGVFVGALVAGQWNPLPLHGRTEYAAAAYELPKIPGGTSLRLAMVNDVLHERYLRHGEAWYAQRARDARKQLAALAATTQPSAEQFDTMDDLAVALERTGDFDAGIALMRQKLALLPAVPPAPPPPEPPASRNASDLYSDERIADEADLFAIAAAASLTPTQHAQYTACANLGTILLLKALPTALKGDVHAVADMRESLGYIRQSIAINPAGHFGRERWQAILVEHLLAAIDHPDLLQEYDAIGDSLGKLDSTELWYYAGREYLFSRALGGGEVSADSRLSIRTNLPRVGMQDVWVETVHPDYLQPMPFDEPTLAIIGMWTQGGGPNPHFALALGRIMEIVEQRELAWNAYERAVELQAGFWPDPKIRLAMVDWCRQRQAEIAMHESPGSADAWQAAMRRKHAAELAWGEAYQSAYHNYEAARITAGKPLDQPGFYDDFFKDRPPIASPPGLADDLLVINRQAHNLSDVLPCMLLGGALFLCMGWLRQCWSDARLRRREAASAEVT